MYRAKILSVTILASLWSSFTVARPSVAEQWRAIFIERLGQCFPGRKPTGVRLEAVAEVLGLSISSVSKILTQEDYDLSFEQAQRLADFCRRDIEDLLAFEVIDRFSTVESLENALRGTIAKRKRLLIKLWVLNRERMDDQAREYRSEPGKFIDRWRATIRRRVAMYLPSPVGQDRTKPHNKAIGILLDKDPTYVSLMLNGPDYLSFEAASTIAANVGVSPEWILAYEILDEFPRLSDLERELDGKSKPFVAMMTSLYGRRVQRRICADRLAKPKKVRPHLAAWKHDRIQ